MSQVGGAGGERSRACFATGRMRLRGVEWEGVKWGGRGGGG